MRLREKPTQATVEDGSTPEQRYLAARTVASAATDATDCALLFDALGLQPTDGLTRPPRLASGAAARAP